MGDDAELLIDEDGGVVTATLHRPERLNALDDGLRRRLADLLHDLVDRPEVRVFVLRGAGRAFSAGADLTGATYPTFGEDWSARRHAAGTWQRLFDDLGRIPQATVAVLHGHVIGGAALLAAACDIRVGADDVQLRIPELAIGIPLTWAGIPLLVREIGLPLTRDWVMTCRAVGAEELHRAGYLQRLVPRDELDAAAAACIAELLAVPPGPLALTRAMTAAIGRTHPAMVAGWADADLLHWSFREPEGTEAARRYVSRTTKREKRQPGTETGTAE